MGVLTDSGEPEVDQYAETGEAAAREGLPCGPRSDEECICDVHDAGKIERTGGRNRRADVPEPDGLRAPHFASSVSVGSAVEFRAIYLAYN